MSLEYDEIVGALGATVSTVTDRTDEAALVVPPEVAVAVKLWLPFDKAAVVKLQAPLPFAVTVPSCVVPSYTLTVLFAAALPVNVSVLSFVIPSPATPLSTEIGPIVGAAKGGVPG